MKETQTKNKKAIIIMSVIIVILSATLIGGIIAFFTDKKEVTNTFTIGNVSINLTEGQVWDDAIANNTIPAIAQNIVPGATIAKEPVVENTGKNPAYVYVKVYVPVTGDDDLFTYQINNGWTKRSEELHTTDDKYNIYVYEYNQTLQPGASTPALFDEVVFADGMTFTPQQADALGDGNGNISVKIKAYAIQSENNSSKASNEMTTAMTTETGEAMGLVGANVDYSTVPGTVAYQAAQNQIQRWDPVNYTISTTETVGSADITTPGASITSGTISTADASQWVVLDVTDDGDVLIIPKNVSSTELKLQGIDGYNNGIGVLNQISQIYINSDLAKSARSLNGDDVNDVENMTATVTSSYNAAVASQYNLTSMTMQHRYSLDANNDIVDNGAGNVASRTFTMTEDLIDYGYEQTTLSSPYISDCWLATRYLGLFPSSAELGLHYIGNVTDFQDIMIAGHFFSSIVSITDDGSMYESYESHPVVPVITLKPGVNMNKVNGTWELSAN